MGDTQDDSGRAETQTEPANEMHCRESSVDHRRPSGEPLRRERALQLTGKKQVSRQINVDACAGEAYEGTKTIAVSF